MFCRLLRSFVVVRCNESVINLGFNLTSDLDQSPHIESICCKLFTFLRFVLRLAKDFGLKSSFKFLYNIFVWPISNMVPLFETNILLKTFANLKRFSIGLFDLPATFAPCFFSLSGCFLSWLISLVQRRSFFCEKIQNEVFYQVILGL